MASRARALAGVVAAVFDSLRVIPRAAHVALPARRPDDDALQRHGVDGSVRRRRAPHDRVGGGEAQDGVGDGRAATAGLVDDVALGSWGDAHGGGGGRGAPRCFCTGSVPFRGDQHAACSRNFSVFIDVFLEMQHGMHN